MPAAAWQLLLRMGGYRYSDDFENANEITRGFNPDECRGGYSVKCGDFVELRSLEGLLVQARILEVDDSGRAGGDEFVGVVIGFPGCVNGACQADGFFVGEVIYFSMKNIFHVEQRG